MKLFRYRPLNDLLFKELFYDEIYLASPMELNDPLDLNGQLNFYSVNEDELKALVHFLCMQTAFLASEHNNLEIAANAIKQMTYENLGKYLGSNFSNYSKDIITKNKLFEILSSFFKKDPFFSSKSFNEYDLYSNLDKLFSKFLNNSAVGCFSESCTNFLMWSHYASGHTGLCLEFELGLEPENENICQFPILYDHPDNGGNIQIFLKLKKVKYSTSLQVLNFFDYLPIFENEYDYDLLNLSKSYWHQFAQGMEDIFLEKLEPWSEEKEWRLVQVNFRKYMPEDRIRKFDRSTLTGVYFGANVSEQTFNRVQNIFRTGVHCPTFYKCNVDGTRGVGYEKIIQTE